MDDSFFFFIAFASGSIFGYGYALYRANEVFSQFNDKSVKK